VPHWIVLETDGDPARWVIERLDESGQATTQTIYASPEVILPVGNYDVHVETATPQVVEVLTQPSGLREEVARPQVKALLTADVRTASAGTNIVAPPLEDLTERVATLVNIKTTVVHPFYASVQAELEESRTAVATLKERHGEDWSGVLQLERDMERAEEAFKAGQLDRVNELATLVQRYAEDEAETASQLGELGASRMVAVRLAIITGAIALAVLAVAGGGIYVFTKRHSLFGSDDSYEYSEVATS
jgi:hypothetical protein